MLKKLLHQIKQFFKPFPEPGSWSYNLQARIYDWQVGGPVTGDDLDIEPAQEPGDNDQSKPNNTDQSTGISNGDSSNSADRTDDSQTDARSDSGS